MGRRFGFFAFSGFIAFMGCHPAPAAAASEKVPAGTSPRYYDTKLLGGSEFGAKKKTKRHKARRRPRSTASPSPSQQSQENVTDQTEVSNQADAKASFNKRP